MTDSFTNILEKDPKNNFDGVVMLSNYTPANTHEEVYLKIRLEEKRILSDDLVKSLPDLPNNNPHYHEWQLRKQTAEDFCNSIAEQKKPLRILDLGCGNGWFSGKMASISSVEIVGLDLNLPELQQAQRLFSRHNLLFCYGDIFENIFISESFDIIVINAAVQYFQSLEKLFNTLFKLLKFNGQVHILDSPFYETHEVENAKKRTVIYYQSMGCPEMANYYFHHTYQELAIFSPTYQKKKINFWDVLKRKSKNPFFWVTVKKP